MLKIDNITKSFSVGTETRRALDGVSLNVKKGDFITIIGANGAGKSTLFNAIAGSFITDSGTITLDGRDITLMSEYKRAHSIGRLFQDPMRGSAPGMTIEENLALAAGAGNGSAVFPSGTGSFSAKRYPCSAWGLKIGSTKALAAFPADKGRRLRLLWQP